MGYNKCCVHDLLPWPHTSWIPLHESYLPPSLIPPSVVAFNSLLLGSPSLAWPPTHCGFPPFTITGFSLLLLVNLSSSSLGCNVIVGHPLLCGCSVLSGRGSCVQVIRSLLPWWRVDSPFTGSIVHIFLSKFGSDIFRVFIK